MLKLHNTFTLCTKNTAQTVCNSVLVSVVSQLKTDRAWVQALRIFTQNGQFDYPVVCTQRNLNTANGSLKAEYSVTLDKSELKGETITGFSLVSDCEVNRAHVEPMQKKEEELTVTATVYLTLDIEGCVPIASDSNPLIGALLGCMPLSDAVTMRWGTCETAPWSAVTTTLDDMQNLVEGTIELTGDSMKLWCKSPTDVKDVVVCLGGEPILRASLRSFHAATYVMQEVVSHERTLDATSPINKCGSASRGLKQFVDVQALHVVKGLVKAAHVMLNFDRSLSLISDPSYRTAAFVSDKEIFLVGQRHGRLCVVASMPFVEKSAHMTDKNEFVLVGKTAYAVYRYVESEGILRLGGGTFPSEGSLDAVVSKRSGSYCFLRRLSDDVIERGYSTGSGYEVVENLSSDPDSVMFRNRYHVCAVTSSDVHAFEASAADLRTIAVLGTLIDAYGVRVRAGYDGIAHIAHDEIPVFNYVSALGSGKNMLIPAQAVPHLYGDFVLIKLPDGRRELYYYYRAQATFVYVTIPQVETVSEVVRINDAVLVRRDDGSLEEYAIVYDRSYLFHPLFEEGETIDAIVTSVLSTPRYRQELTITIQ